MEVSEAMDDPGVTLAMRSFDAAPGADQEIAEEQITLATTRTPGELISCACSALWARSL
ncbi:hypothetical protein [Pseudorhodoferax sp.]|uniref:hypothetical protein n=1 Tax=Pseudorhodoferax sp. TaxID=1993553 RepID=UPI002DD67CCB|nr:hypothetical protein [Pseudorhodoferax sp.]